MKSKSNYDAHESFAMQASLQEPCQQNRGFERSPPPERFPRRSPFFESGMPTMETRNQRGRQRGRGQRRGGHRGGRQGGVQRGGMTDVAPQRFSQSAQFQEIAERGRGRPEGFRGNRNRGRSLQEGTFGRGQRRDDVEGGIGGEDNQSVERLNRSRGAGQQRGRNRRRRGGRRN